MFVQLINKKSYSSAIVSSPLLEVQIDIVPAPKVSIGGRRRRRLGSCRPVFLHDQLPIVIFFLFFFSLFFQEWEVSESKYSHLNMKMTRLEVSDHVSGILGDSSRLKYDDKGLPVMEAYDKDGGGVLEGSVESYEVTDLLSTSHPLYSKPEDTLAL